MFRLQRHSRAVKQWSWWTLTTVAFFALLCRGLVATGYMPSQHPTSGGFSITLCTSHGPAIDIAIDLGPDTPTHNSPYEECPFALLAQHDLVAPPVLSVLPLHTSHYRAPKQGYSSLPTLPAQGPPLGSRAPPLHLA